MPKLINNRGSKARRRIIVGNWKMNPVSLKEAEKLFRNVSKAVLRTKKTDIVICAPAVYLVKLRKINKKVSLGAQDAYFGEVGAYTGQISPLMLGSVGAKYVILGHSERRALGEDNNLINQKLRETLAARLVPVLCVGESERDENHGYFNLVRAQLEECLSGISKNSISKIIIAYEPIWAISSTANRRDATPADSLEMSIFIKKIISDKFGPDAANTRIIYGGSANEKDAEGFLRMGGVDGLLPGRASLDPKKFGEIVSIAESIQ